MSSPAANPTTDHAEAVRKLHTIRDQASRHVRPLPQQLEGYRDRLYQVVRQTGYNRDVFRAALEVEDEIRRRHNWME